MKSIGRVFRRVLLLSLSAMLTGCLEMSEEVWIYDDLSGRVRVDIAVSATLLALGDDEANGSLNDLRAEQERTRAQLEAHPNVSAARVEEFADAGLRHFVIEADVIDARAMDEAFSALFNPQQTVTEQNGGASAPLWNFHIERAGGRAFAFVQVFEQGREAPVSQPPGAPEDEFSQLGEAMGKAMLASVFGDRYVTVTFHAPRIVSSDGTLNEERTTAQWRIPLVDLLGDHGFHKELRAEFKPPIPWALWGFLGALIVAVVLAWANRARIARRGIA